MGVDDNHTKVLLHMEGADESPVFIDESGKTWTAADHAQIDTAQYKFGLASGLFDGTTDYISTPNNEDLDFGTDDWTIDWWMMRNGASAYGGLYTVSTNAYNSMHLGFEASGTTMRMVSNFTGSIATNLESSDIVPNLTWTHIAFVRYGNVLTLYQAGVSKDTADCTGWTCNSGGAGASLGRRFTNSTVQCYNGWIDEFRISKGIARWKDEFTPPTSAYISYSIPKIRTINTIVMADLKTINGIVSANIKSVQGLP